MSKRQWAKSFKKTAASSHFNRKIQEKIRQAKAKGLRCYDLLQILKNAPNFLGVFPADQLQNLYIMSYPTFLIANIDDSHQRGSHWISIRISKKNVEIFDSLGFDSILWGKTSPNLLYFLNRYLSSHKFLYSPVLQAKNSASCGLFSAFFIRNRQKFSFEQCCNFFSRNLYQNDEKLLRFFRNRFT